MSGAKKFNVVYWNAARLNEILLPSTLKVLSGSHREQGRGAVAWVTQAAAGRARSRI